MSRTATSCACRICSKPFWLTALLVLAMILAAEGKLALADPILEIYDATLTTNLTTGNSLVQGVRPQAVQRGASIGGSGWAAALAPPGGDVVPAPGAHHGGGPSPDGSGCGGGFVVNMAPPAGGDPTGMSGEGGGSAGGTGGVGLMMGTTTLRNVDIRLPGPGFTWTIGHSYNTRQKDSSGAYMVSDGYQGKNWFQDSQPAILLYDDADNAKDVIYLIYGADRYIEFKRQNSSSNQFKAKNGAAGVMAFATGAGSEPDTYTFTTQAGSQIAFFGFDSDSGVAKGQIWKKTDPAGNVAYVGDATTGSTAITSGFDSSGRIIKAYDTADRRYTYTYTSGRLTEVEAETKTGGTWSSPTGVAEVAKVQYSYYIDADADGQAGDLKLVTVSTPLTDSGMSVSRKTLYRYYEGAYHATNNPGYENQIKMIVQPEGYRKYDWAQDSDLDDDPIGASEANLKPYASAYFKYDTDRRIVSAWNNGACGCSGQSNGEMTYEYESNGSFSGTSGYDTAWYSRTIVKRPDNSYVTQYFDELGQPLHKVMSDGDPDNTSPAPNFWVTKVVRNSDGVVTDIHSPANVTAYTHSSASITTSSSVGLVTTYVLESSGNLKGLVLDVKHKTGTSGSAYLDSTVAYSSRDLVVGDVTVTRPFIASGRVYSTEVTSGTSGSYLTSYAYDSFYSGTNTNVLYVVPKQITTTYPAVSTGNNGPNSSTTSTVYLRKDGTAAFTQSPDGIFNYTKFTSGQLVKQIVDAQTNHGSDFASGDDPSSDFGITETGSGLRLITEHAYDAQGRRDLSTLHSETANDKRYLKSYYSRLKDHRLVTLGYSDYEATPKFYGPVSYSVTNQAGRPEVQATVKLTNNESTTALTGHVDETDADPITAMDLGTVAHLTTSIYDETGAQLEESRPYFLIPASGAGSDGTNFDATFYGYDDSGRSRRVKDPTGTIRRTTYDGIGRFSAQYVGTNDNRDPGGEPSGTNNMVKVSDVAYDSGGVGNSLVTTRTAYLDGTGSPATRVTTFAYDVRGRVLLQTNPTAPHVFNKYDNMGRAIASGQFSSTANIVVGTDDPTTETSNRMALGQTFFDELGRVWKSQRHKIDDADGSDNDTLLTLTWYDADGRVIKVDGEQLTKTAYDRIGRATSQFVLATDNDSVYADADDVSGDKVLSQSVTVYDPNDGNVIMNGSIDRLHDDVSSTGAPDSNADADELMFTAANITGRIQITATWYDRFDRVADTASYGTYNGANFDRDGLSVPSRSDTVLVTSTTYNTDGSVKETTDPRALVTRIEYDDLGRQTAMIANYVNGTPTSVTGDDDVYTRFVYVNGLRTKMWVDFDGDGVVDTSAPKDQVTEYTYGVTTADSPGASLFASNRLLRKVTYPDSSSSDDVVRFAYNAQGQQIWTQDQAGNIIQTDLDDSGRATHKRVTTVASGFDNAVLRISTTYDSLGRRSLVTQYDNATVGSGSVVDEVKFTYEDWGLIEKLQEDHNSAVVAQGDDYSVSYTYAKATTGRNTIRRATMALPASNSSVNYNYLSSGNLLDDAASRVTTVAIASLTIAEYRYNGVSQVVGIDHPEPDVMWNKFSTTGVYPDLDRFNRVTTSKWTADLATDQDFYSYTVTYDRDSNITRLDDNVYGGTDVVFTMDNLNRLTDSQEGTWNGSSITSKTRQDTWTLEQTGNWALDKLDLNGDNDYVDTGELNDRRTHNEVNELTARDTDDNGTNNYTLTYDADGNLTDDGASYKYVYDPFGRLRKVKNQSNTLVGEYWYNGLGWRIVMQNDTDSDGDVDSSDKKYHLVYDENWRIAWVYRESDTNPKERFVYHAPGLGGMSASDNLILRDRDENSGWTAAGDGALEQRRYMLGNWRGDVVAIVKDNKELVETVAYSPYGVAYGRPGGDTNDDWSLSTTDENQIQTWIGGAYHVLGDVDLDGDVDSTDKAIVVGGRGVTMGRGVLSNIGSRRGYGAYERDANLAVLYHVRNRVYNTTLGRWTRRDPLEYADGVNQYTLGPTNPLGSIDPSGTLSLTFTPTQPSANSYSSCGEVYCEANLLRNGSWPCLTSEILVIIGKIKFNLSCGCSAPGDSVQDEFFEMWALLHPYAGVAPPQVILTHTNAFDGLPNCRGTFKATAEPRGFCKSVQGYIDLLLHFSESVPWPGSPTGLIRFHPGTCCGTSIESVTNRTASTFDDWAAPSTTIGTSIHVAKSQWNCCGTCAEIDGCGSTTGPGCIPGPNPACIGPP